MVVERKVLIEIAQPLGHFLTVQFLGDIILRLKEEKSFTCLGGVSRNNFRDNR